MSRTAPRPLDSTMAHVLPPWLRVATVRPRPGPARGILLAVLLSGVFWTGFAWVVGAALG